MPPTRRTSRTRASVSTTHRRLSPSPAPAAAINGSLPSPTTFAANASDPAGSGVSQVEFFECTDQSNDCSSGVWSPLGIVPAPGPYSVSWAIPAADGNHALAAVATDNAGHTATAIRNVDVDRTAPNTSIVTKPADPSNGSPSFTFTSTEPGSTFECSIDGGGILPVHQSAHRRRASPTTRTPSRCARPTPRATRTRRPTAGRGIAIRTRRMRP